MPPPKVVAKPPLKVMLLIVTILVPGVIVSMLNLLAAVAFPCTLNGLFGMAASLIPVTIEGNELVMLQVPPTENQFHHSWGCKFLIE